MPFVCLKPTWPSETFRRTIAMKGKKGKDEAKTFVFRKHQPEEISDEEMKSLKQDIGKAIFEVEFDEKMRIRYIDPSDPAKEVPSQPVAATE